MTVGGRLLLLTAAQVPVRSWIVSGTYPALALLVMLENLIPPIPSEIILPLAGYYVGQGTLAFAPAVLAATAGSLAGALVLYALGRFGGRPLVLRYGRFLSVDEARLRRAEGWFARWGDALVLFGRMVPGARSIVSIPAGLVSMGLLRFSLLTALGSTMWNALLIGAGWGLGEYWRGASDAVQTASLVVACIAAVAVVLFLVGRFVRRRRVERERP